MEGDHNSNDQDLIEGEPSDMFDTDSSEDDRDDIVQPLGDIQNEIEKDKNNILSPIKQDEEEDEQKEEEIQREEMGGILVYDAYARMKGCEKIEKYFEENPLQKVQTDILFSKAESKEVSRELFGEQARARDFMCDQDKNFFRNLPRFHS